MDTKELDCALTRLATDLQKIRETLAKPEHEPRRLVGHISSENPCVVIIDEQTHRCDAFTPDGRTCRADNGIRLRSEGNPQYYVDVVCVRGIHIERDNQPIVCLDAATALKVLEAFREYTETNGGAS